MPWWRFWKPETEQEKHNAFLQESGRLALESGDIPSTAKERIAAHLNSNAHFFSSDLSVREFLLTKEAGIEPISQVMGTAFYNVSMFGQYTAFRFTGEMEKLTHSHTEARRLAIERMRLEAKLLGASGVIGVRLVSKQSSLSVRTTEFTAIGTAVRVPGYPPSAEPFTCHLNGQEFWQLYKAGYKPKTLIMGTCSYFIYTNFAASYQQRGLFGIARNQEIELYTRGFNHARNAAIERLSAELAQVAADGAVGVTITHAIQPIYAGRDQINLLINFTAIGTAVDAGTPIQPQGRLMCLNLQKKTTEPLVAIK